MKARLWRRPALCVMCITAMIAASPALGQEGGASPSPSPVQDVAPYSPEEKAILAGLDKDVRVFERGVQIFNNSVKHIIERAYLNEKALLDRKFRTSVEEASRSAAARRLEAIKEYEAFVKRYPNDQAWTPDVLMRLAELYYEKAEVDFQYADRLYQRRLLEIERVQRLAGRDVPMPPRPIKEYDAALDYYREVLTRFPSFKNRDMVIYVLGFVLRLAGQEVEASEDEAQRGLARELHDMARQALLGLVCANKYAPLDKPNAPAPPAGYSLGVTKPAQDPGGPNPFDRFDPYADCEPLIKLSDFQGEELQKRRFLLSQSWFLIGEEHFDADPLVDIDSEEKEMLNREYQAFRGPYREETFRNRWNELLNEKKLRALRLHNYYSISAYTQVAEKFQDSNEYNSALYKRAWTYFKIDAYLKALAEFDELLVRAKEKDLQENAVRYVALCAFYQKDMPDDPFGWLFNYYQKRGWVNDKGEQKFTHVKAAMQQLAEVLWEESQPPPDDTDQSYDARLLEKALTIYRWILHKGGFEGDEQDAANPDRDWVFFRGKAPIQVRVLQILGLLMANDDQRVRSKYPRDVLYQERKLAFDRFTVYKGSPHQRFAEEYDRRWNTDKDVAEALMVLREHSLMAMGTDFFNLGLRDLQAADKATAELTALKARQKELEALVNSQGRGWQKARTELGKVLGRIGEVEDRIARNKKAYEPYFAQAIKAFQVIMDHPQHKDTLRSYEAQFFLGQALFALGKYLEAARVFHAVQTSKISVKRANEALTWRFNAFTAIVEGLPKPADPDPEKDKTVERQEIPATRLEYHQLLGEMIAANPKGSDVAYYRYQIAADYYRHRQFAEAKPLFQELMEKHCETENGLYAGQHLLTILQIEQPEGYLDQLERLVNLIRTKNCGAAVTCKPGDANCEQFVALRDKTAEDMKRWGPSILRAKAFEAFNAKEYEKAAMLFAEIVERYPDSKDIALFLYNAAYAYERIKRYRSAKQTYELIFTKYRKEATEQEVRDEKDNLLYKGILDRVLEPLAQVAEKALDYEAALKYYGVLATEASFAKHPGRVNWYYRYARLLKIHGRYDEAVTYFRDKYVAEARGQIAEWRRMGKTEADPEKKAMYEQFIKDAEIFIPRADLEIGQIRERQKNYRAMVTSYLAYVGEIEKELDRKRGQITNAEFWVKNLGDFAKAREMMLLLQRVLDAYREHNLGRQEMTRIENRIVENFDRFKLPPRTQAASSAAAIVFSRMQHNLATFLKVRLVYKPVRGRPTAVPEIVRASQNVVDEALKELNAEVSKFTKMYTDKRDQYPDDVWYMAFQAHLGKIYEHAASLVADPKLPPLAQKFLDARKKAFDEAAAFEFEEKLKEAVFGNPSTLAKAGEIWDKLAKGVYQAALDHAAKVGIVTEWTRQVREWFARIDPSKPYINEPKIEALR